MGCRQLNPTALPHEYLGEGSHPQSTNLCGIPVEQTRQLPMLNWVPRRKRRCQAALILPTAAPHLPYQAWSQPDAQTPPHPPHLGLQEKNNPHSLASCGASR